jgi:hypothetical protein
VEVDERDALGANALLATIAAARGRDGRRLLNPKLH